MYISYSLPDILHQLFLTQAIVLSAGSSPSSVKADDNTYVSSAVSRLDEQQRLQLVASMDSLLKDFESKPGEHNHSPLAVYCRLLVCLPRLGLRYDDCGQGGDTLSSDLYKRLIIRIADQSDPSSNHLNSVNCSRISATESLALFDTLSDQEIDLSVYLSPDSTRRFLKNSIVMDDMESNANNRNNGNFQLESKPKRLSLDAAARCLRQIRTSSSALTWRDVPSDLATRLLGEYYIFMFRLYF